MKDKLTMVFNRKAMDCGLLVILALFFCRKLLFIAGLPLGGDALSWVLPQKFCALHSWYLSAWNVIGFPGEPEQIFPFNIFLTFVFSILGITGIKIIIFLTYLLAGVGMYLFVYRYSQKYNMALFSAILYMINRPIIGQFLGGHYSICLGYAFFPFLFLSWDIVLGKLTFKDLLVFAMLSSIFLLISHLTYIYMSLIFFIPFAIVTAIVKIKNQKKVLKQVFKLFLFLPILILLLSSITIFPFLKGITTSDIFFRPLGFLIKSLYKYAPPALNAITLNGAENLSPTNLSIFFLILLPVFSYLAILLHRDRYIFFFTGLAIVTTFLTAGINLSHKVFLWLFLHIPMLSNIRVPSRWLVITVFCYAFLSGITFDIILTHLRIFIQKITGVNYIKRAIISTLSILILLCLIFPSISDFNYGLQTYKIPNEYLELYNWIKSQTGDFSVLTLPFMGGDRWMDPKDPGKPPGLSSTWDFGMTSSMEHGKTILSSQSYYPPTSKFLKFIWNLIKEQKTCNLAKILGSFNIKYIISQNYAALSEREFFSRQDGLDIVYQKNNNLIYQNLYWTEKIHGLSNYTLVVGGTQDLNSLERQVTTGGLLKTNDIKTSYQKINPTKYLVHIRTNLPFFLAFSEAYHPLWKAYIDNKEINSIPTNYFLNGFFLNKTGEYDLVIKFQGQKYVYLGGMISLISWLLCLIYLYPQFRKRKVLQ